MTVTYIISWSERGTVGPEVAASIPAKNSKHRELASTFEHIELPATLLDYFLRSNKSNINQRCLTRHHRQPARTSTVRLHTRPALCPFRTFSP